MLNKLQDCQGLDGLFSLFQKQTIRFHPEYTVWFDPYPPAVC